MLPFKAIQKKARDAKVSDRLINLGRIDEVISYDDDTRITITTGPCKSAAFYWFSNNQLLWFEEIQIARPQKKIQSLSGNPNDWETL